MPRRPLRVVIADDEPPARALLRFLLTNFGAKVVGEAANGGDAVSLAVEHAPDVVLLDIAMPGMGGMEAARELAGLHSPPQIIFCTAYDGFAVAAFDVAALDYLLKPLDEDRLARALRRAERECADRPTSVAALKYLWIPHRADLVRVRACDVERVEAERDYVRIYVDGHGYLLRATMDQMMQRLESELYVRLHRSTIVRQDLIQRLRHEGGGVWSAALVDGYVARIGRSYLEAVRRRCQV